MTDKAVQDSLDLGRIPTDLCEHIDAVVALSEHFRQWAPRRLAFRTYRDRVSEALNSYVPTLLDALGEPPLNSKRLLELRMRFTADLNAASLNLGRTLCDRELRDVRRFAERCAKGGRASRRLVQVDSVVRVALAKLGPAASARDLWDWLKRESTAEMPLKILDSSDEIYIDGQRLYVVEDRSGTLSSIRFDTFRTKYVYPAKRRLP